MKFPICIIKNLSSDLVERWNNEYAIEFLERDRHIDEGLWVRSQFFHTRHKSGWKSIDDKRRRLVHYLNKYDLIYCDGKPCLAMVSSYLWIHLSFPNSEIQAYKSNILKGLHIGKWECIKSSNDHNIYCREDLLFEFKVTSESLNDIEEGRTFPDNYLFLEIVIKSRNCSITDQEIERPWGILKKGPRKRDKTEQARYINSIKEICEYFPAYIELGCGPSIEAGIPPLHFLHNVYFVSKPIVGTFILGNEQDKLAFLVASSPEVMYEQFSHMYKSCFLAEPTFFYQSLVKLYHRGLAIGDVITNNFDGLAIRVGLKEKYLRRYDLNTFFPNIKYDSNAKSLITIGTHADRRRVLQSAREQGLKIIHIDPEGFEQNGSMLSYPKEGIKKDDIVFHTTAANFMKDLCEHLKL